MCNEAVKMTSNSSHHQTNASSIQIMRVSNASGSCEDVVVPSKPASVRRHRVARCLAVLSGWFKSVRDCGINLKKIDENSTRATRTTKRKTKRKPWHLFKLKGKTLPYDAAQPSYQHFQEPLNVERPSLAGGNIDMNGYSDAEWYDLNKDEMSLFEAQVSNIVSDFNGYSKINSNGISDRGDDGSNSGIGESSNSLWSHHNLSMPCKSNVVNPAPETIPASVNSSKPNHITRTQPIRSKKSVEQMVLIDDIRMKPIDSDGNCNFDESCKLSSGFGSDESDANSPREFVRKFHAFTNSSATSDFFEKAFSYHRTNDSNEHSPATTATTSADATIQLPILKNMQKMSKKHRIQINSRKLFGMLSEEHTPSLPVNMTPQNKSPPECRTEKVRNGTPFKICCSIKLKQMHVTEI